jgi:hypothetical protein
MGGGLRDELEREQLLRLLGWLTRAERDQLGELAREAQAEAPGARERMRVLARVALLRRGMGLRAECVPARSWRPGCRCVSRFLADSGFVGWLERSVGPVGPAWLPALEAACARLHARQDARVRRPASVPFWLRAREAVEGDDAEVGRLVPVSVSVPGEVAEPEPEPVAAPVWPRRQSWPDDPEDAVGRPLEGVLDLPWGRW